MKFTNISQDIFAAKCNSFPFNQYFNLIINLIPPFWIIEYKPYNYLNLPPHLRLPLARLRSSAHCRMIELGRYTFHPQLHQRKACVLIVGSLKMKSIFWSIVVYIYDGSKREDLFSHCTSLNCCFKCMSSRDKFITILLGQDPRLPFLVADLVRKSCMRQSQFHDVHDEN